MIMAASALESGPQLRPGSPHSPSIIVENIITNIIITNIIVENIIVANIIVNINANLIIVNIMSKSCRTVPPSSMLIQVVITIFNQVLLVILIMIVMMF